jgi:hypothetical protein
MRRSPDAFFTNGDDPALQQAWAREQGMPGSTALDQILLAQLEHHRAEVFYNLDPLRYDSSFVRRLPASVKHAIAWRAAPSPGADFRAYDAVVCNFPSILEQFRQRGYRTAYFLPSYDPDMDSFAATLSRPVDVVFVGAYSRHHMRRAAVLEAVARLANQYCIEMHLDRSRLTKVAETWLGLVPPLSRHRRPDAIRAVSAPAVFGRDLYEVFSRAKVVINCAIDMSGVDRGNMRCFEAMGCGAVMVSDEGRYPDGMRNDTTMLTYSDAASAILQVERILGDESSRVRISRAGHDLLATRYSKSQQWADFVSLVESL